MGPTTAGQWKQPICKNTQRTEVGGGGGVDNRALFQSQSCGLGGNEKGQSLGSSPASGFLLGWFLCHKYPSTSVSSATFGHSVHPVKCHLLHGAWVLIATEINLDATAQTSLCRDSRSPTSAPPWLTYYLSFILQGSA